MGQTGMPGWRHGGGHASSPAPCPEGQGRGLRADRLTQVAFSDSHLAEKIWVNRVGTFGVGSAGYWWGRAGALLVRLSHYYAPSTVRALWVLLYADDGKATAGGPRFELPLLNHLFLL